MTVIADGGYRGTRAVIPRRRRRKDEPLVEWKEAHNASHQRVRARIEHSFAKLKVWKVLRDCRLRGDGSATAVAASPGSTTSRLQAETTTKRGPTSHL